MTVSFSPTFGRTVSCALIGAGLAVAAGTPTQLESIQSAALTFEPNVGQADGGARFISRLGGQQVKFLPRTVAFGSVTMEFIGANRSATVTGSEPLTSKTNYLTDSDPRKWKRNVPNFARVRYRNLYPGIDLIFYGNQQSLEYDLVVAPGANPGAIRLHFTGAAAALDEAGDVVVRTGDGQFRQRKPVVYQEGDYGRLRVAGTYALDHGDIVFRTQRYDRSRKLVIDPVLSYVAALVNNYSAGWVLTPIALDGSGYLYTVAWPNLVLKMNISSSGTATVVYSTYLGTASNIDGIPFATIALTGIAADSFGNAYVTGGSGGGQNVSIVNGFQTSCSLVPNEGGSCVFLAKLSSDGTSILYSSYTGPNPGQWRPSVAADSSGFAYLAASTPYNFYPTKNAWQPVIHGNSDIAITKVDTNQSGPASLIYSTFFGGSLADVPAAIAADSAGNVYVTGATQSPDFPLRNPLQDAYGGPPGPPDQGGDVFVVKLDSAGSLLYSTYLGGSGNDKGDGIAIDSNSNIYVSGSTTSADFPIHNGLQATFGGGGGGIEQIGDFGDAFVTKISADGSELLYSSYLGGSAGEAATGIAVDPIGGVYVTGTTFSADFASVSPLHGVGVLKSNDSGSTWEVPGIGLPFATWAIAIDPQQTTLFYAATDKGVFRSADAASTWTATTVTSEARAVAFDSSVTPSIVYAATAAGVFKSSDGGATWTAANSGLASLDTSSIMVVPGHLPAVWVYARSGLYKSSDGGNTWSLATSHVDGLIHQNDLCGLDICYRAGLAYDPNSPNTVYASNDQGFISKTINGGATWSPLTPPTGNIYSTAVIAIGSDHAIYANTDDNSVGASLFTSTDGGTTWSLCGLPESNYQALAGGITFDPAAPTTIYFAGLVFGAYRSTDGCATWSVLNPASVFRDIEVDPSAPTHLYAASYLWPGTTAAFVAKIDATKSGPASLVYSSYYGATGDTTGDGIAVDSAGNAFVIGSVGLYSNTPITNADGTLTPHVSPWTADTLLFKVGGLVVTSPSTPTAQSGAVRATFSNITTAGITSITMIDPATAGQAPGQFAVSNLAYDISTTASVSGPIVSCFVVSSVNDATTFANLRVLHSEQVGSTYQLVDRTILSGANAPNFGARTLCAQTTSLSPFYLARAGQRLVPQFDQTKSYKAGSTLPVKVQLLSSTGANLSSGTIPLTVRNIRLLGSATLASTVDSGDSSPDLTFRYDGSQYIYNLSLKNYTPGRYGMSVFVGSDRNFFYTVEFQVR